VNFPLLEERGERREERGEGREERGYRGLRVCRMSPGTWGSEITTCHHPRGYDYYWMVGQYHNDEPEAQDTDRWALDHGYIAVTPTRIDVTAYDCLDIQFGL
jgi:5'-nucleotidase